MTFICTCSQDVTTDVLLRYLDSIQTFRFNIDKPEDYAWEFSCREFMIKNVRCDLTIDSSSITSFYLRKPIYFNGIDLPKEGCLENWCREETVAVFEDFYRECESRGLTSLVHSRNNQYGKLRQMLSASKHFRVADWYMFHGTLPSGLGRRNWVVKSLTGTPIGKGKALFVREVDPVKLDLSYPWFIQERILGEEDVTVVYVNGSLFSYCYPRDVIKDSADVRKAMLDEFSLWQPCELSTDEQSSIRGFMAETGYRFGRFDFIRKDGELWFLELNPNGQWAWLDEDGKNGLLNAIANQIIEDDVRHKRMK